MVLFQLSLSSYLNLTNEGCVSENLEFTVSIYLGFSLPTVTLHNKFLLRTIIIVIHVIISDDVLLLIYVTCICVDIQLIFWKKISTS